jgi:hypothetical protein
MHRGLFICQIGGRLTALRYPEREIVAVHGLPGRGPDWSDLRRPGPGSARRGGSRRGLDADRPAVLHPGVDRRDSTGCAKWPNGLRVDARCHTFTKLR